MNIKCVLLTDTVLNEARLPDCLSLTVERLCVLEGRIPVACVTLVGQFRVIEGHVRW